MELPRLNGPRQPVLLSASPVHGRTQAQRYGSMHRDNPIESRVAPLDTPPKAALQNPPPPGFHGTRQAIAAFPVPGIESVPHLRRPPPPK